MIGGTIFGTIFFVLASVFNGANMTRIPATITLLAIFGSIGANIYWLPLLGIRATAIIFSATSAFMGLSALFFTYLKFFREK